MTRAILTLRSRSVLFPAVLVCLMALANCTTANLAGGTGTSAGIAAPLTPARDEIGTGPNVIGLLAHDDPDNLSGGAADSIYLAGKLAIANLAGTPARLIVRRADADPKILRKAVEDFLKAGVRIVIGPADSQVAAAIAATLAEKQAVPVLSLGRIADLGVNLYGAGQAAGNEAIATVNEMARRGYRSVLVVSDPAEPARTLAAAITAAATDAGIKITPLEAATPAILSENIGKIAGAGTPPAAIYLALTPARAAALAATIRAHPALKSVPLVGNAGWMTAPPALTGAWYPAYASPALKGFVDKFRAAYGKDPALDGALAYDLVVLAAALPQGSEPAPYSAEILTAEAGFKGFSGSFRFGADGLAARDFAMVELK